MKVSKSWLKELVDLKISEAELVRLLPLRTIGLKEIAKDFFELDMKGYNRADLLSMRGVAYEISAITDSKVKFNEEETFIWQKQNFPKANVTVENPKLAPVYCIAKIESLNVEQSDNSWVKRLSDCGMRTVNNVADVTNLLMIEYGQPMHAFDAAQVDGETIIVRAAKEGEQLTTLDGKVRKLTTEDLLITDPKKALGLAGVMGGKDSEVSDSTTTILLEAAIFDPKTLRKTATRLGLVSEASKKFYHGLTKKRLFQALNAAIKMYQELGGKLTALTIVDNLSDKVVTIKLTQDKINSLIGIKIAPDEVENYLTKLNFKIQGAGVNLIHPEGGNVNIVTPPYWRLDINIEEDVIEEVARMYGYEKIPAKPLDNNIPHMDENPVFGLIQRLKQALYSLGLTEVQTYSYYSSRVISNVKTQPRSRSNRDRLNRGQISNLIKIANPISSETEYLRDNIWPNLVEVVAKNVRQGFDDIAIFEIGKIYYRNEKEEAAEKYSLSMALMNNTDNPLAELHERFQKLNQQLSLGIEETEKDSSAEELESFHPNRLIQLSYKGKIVGGLAEVHKRVTDKLGINQRVAILEIGLNKF